MQDALEVLLWLASVGLGLGAGCGLLVVGFLGDVTT